MTVNVNIYSQKDFEESTEFNDSNVDQFVNDYFICINASGFVHSVPHFKEQHQRVLNLFFDDVDRDQNKFDIIFNITFPAKAINNGQATQIKQFIDSIPTGANLHIYCPKGKSRSVAVAKFAEEYKNNVIIDYPTHNQFVYNTLKNL